MATMVAEARPLPLQAVQSLVDEHYGIEGTVYPLTGERDQNVRIRSAGGESYVFKIAHADEPEAESDLARTALLHVERRDPTLPCPRVVRTVQGSTQVRFRDPDGQARSACLVSFLPGCTVASAPRSAAQRAACGIMAGRLALALADFDHPGAHRALIWDVRQLHCIPLLLDEINDFPDAARTRALLETLAGELAPRLPALRAQVVHNDLNPLNVLVDDQDPSRVTGLIDFGDAVHSARVADAAVVAAELIPEDCAGLEGAARCVMDVLRSYETAMPLDAAERSLLGALIAARLITGLVVQQWHRRRNPAGQHYVELAPDFIRMRLELAQGLSIQRFDH